MRLSAAFLHWLVLIASVATAASLRAETPPDQEAAATALRGVASNLQNNRDGTVRFVRFSKPIVTDEHFAHVAAFKQLDYLAVVTPTVSDEALGCIGGLTNLDTLFLSDSSVTDATLAKLTELQRLERLYLDRTAVTDAGLASLANLASLTTLTLDGTKITDAGLEQLSALKHLQVLKLSRTQVTGTGLAKLAGLPELQTLYLDDTPIDGAELAHLANAPSLASLSLRGVDVRVDDLAHLAGHPTLERLWLQRTRVTAADVSRLRESWPRVTIHVSPEPGQERNALQRFLAGESLRGAPVVSEEANERELESSQAAEPAYLASDAQPDFQRHVIPLLGRLGCNGRTCHGSFQGQGGFRLSMFGYDFDADHEALTGGDEPRVNLSDPDASLILQKPTLREDHDGGLRFEAGGWEHKLLLRWIESGAPNVDEVHDLVRLDVTPAEIRFAEPGESETLKVVAVWSDGLREDVTGLTRFLSNDEAVAEVSAAGLVEGKLRGDTHVVASYDNGIVAIPVLIPHSELVDENFPAVPTPTRIDALVADKLGKLGIVPSDLSTDEEFLRRVSLDVAGTLPTPEEVRRFVNDSSPDKRARKIDELLETPAYVEWWTNWFGDLTACNSQYLGTTDMNSPAAGQWTAWLRRRLQDNAGWDEIAAGIVLAESRRPGQSYDDYAAEQSSYLRSASPDDFTAPENPMHYYWFRSNNQLPAERALSFGYVFLGVRLQCAQCHKHPFDEWSQEDFEQFTQFFTRVKVGISPEAADSQELLKTQLGVPVKLDTAALRRQMYLRVSAEGLPIPWNEVYIEPTQGPDPARVLGGRDVDLAEFDDPREPLMAWLLDPENPYFARAMVNRMWAHYFGRGIVDAPDDLSRGNPPSNGPLLDWLSTRFVAEGFDLKWLHRTIAGSRTYQLSWRANETNRDDERNFSRAVVRRLPAEVTIDAILQATAADGAKYAANVDTRKIAQHPRSIQARGIDYSLLVFGKPLRTTNCDCERQMQPTLLQSLYVRNDHEVIEWLERPDGWLRQVAGELGETLSAEASDSPGDASETARADVASEQIDALIESAWLRTLSRHPRADELERAREHLGASANTVEGLRDLMWALINTQEFLTNH